MKLILTSDLHQRIQKWGDLVSAVQREKPRFVLIAGDLLPKVEMVSQQAAFFPEMAQHLRSMKQAGPLTVLTYLGNDDAHILESRLDDLQGRGLCVNLNGRVHREEGLVFCGMNKVRDYPFGYKHWCAPDDNFVTCPVQLCGEGLTLDAKGRWIELPNLREYLLAKPSLHNRLEALRSQLTPTEIGRSMWLVHNPPADLGIDICYDGRQVGSPSITRFIQDTQPLFGCSGHIHESPYQPGGKWAARVGGRSGSSRGRKARCSTTSAWMLPTISALARAAIAASVTPRSLPPAPLPDAKVPGRQDSPTETHGNQGFGKVKQGG